jgi:hypothetical protein
MQSFTILSAYHAQSVCVLRTWDRKKEVPKREVKETNVTSIGTSEISAVKIVDENLGFPHVQTKECKTGTRGMDSKLVQEKP